ncbi:2-oxo acid dehydrogenase subunit E2 [Nocardia grenadensis]|uniref:2-oxo acid dehydrogenase subunit E2 n=1 Tax=Nocardia grenadensis TaxID=931537 RepID=UPI003D71F92C
MTIVQRPARVLATPAARRAAHDLAVRLSEMQAPGPIRRRDVLAYARRTSPPPEVRAVTPPPGAAVVEPRPVAPAVASSPVAPGVRSPAGATVRPVSRIRRLAADRALASLRESAQLTQTFEVDMTEIARLRAMVETDFERREGVALTFLPFVAKAAVEALARHPDLNACIDAGHTAITYHDRVSLGIAVDTPHGLLCPVVPAADDLSLAGLARAIAGVADAARNGNLRAEQSSGGTFTMTDIGSQGALFDTPILVNGQAAMLGFGAIVRRPVVTADSDGRDVLGIRSMCHLPLTYDHRLIDGADAGRFLTTVKDRLEAGAFHAEVGLDP